MRLNRFRQPGRDAALAAPATCVAALVVAAATGACYPSPVDPVGVPVPPTPYVRAPYVQSVTDSSAAVLWLARPGTADSAWYRVPAVDSAWRGVPVRDHRGGTRVVRLSGLPAGERVEYVVSAGGARFGPQALKTAPPPGSADGEIRVLLFGDSGWGGPGQVDLARRMGLSEWDLSIHVGDIAYDDGAADEFTQRHFRVYARTFASTPFYPSIGNHDVQADGGRSYDAAFLWPEPFPGARYYAFRWGRTLFVSLDTASPSEDVEDLRAGTGRQLEWLRATLREAAADSTVDWIITFQHHPLYSHAIGISGHGLDRELRAQLLPLFERYGVDLVTAGHDHHYERTWPIRGGRRVPAGCGPAHVLSGGGGASRYARDITNTSLLAEAYRGYQYVDLTIGSDRIRGRTIARDGEVVDDFVVRRYPGAYAGPPPGCPP